LSNVKNQGLIHRHKVLWMTTATSSPHYKGTTTLEQSSTRCSPSFYCEECKTSPTSRYRQQCRQ